MTSPAIREVRQDVAELLPPRAQADGTLRRIQETALVLFAERGYHGVSMRELAAATGIRASSIYAHVAGKEPDDLVFGRDGKRMYGEMAMLMLLRRLPTGNVVDGRAEVFADIATVHGFRAGFSSWARERTRFRVETIETALAHRETDAVVRSYSHLAEYKKDRAALASAWAAFIEHGEAKGKVVNLRSKRSA